MEIGTGKNTKTKKSYLLDKQTQIPFSILAYLAFLKIF